MSDYDETEEEEVGYMVDPAHALRQMCSCGHSQAAHAGSINHGACHVLGCECAKYTWVPNKEDKPEPAEEPHSCYCCDEPATAESSGGLPVCKYHS